MITVFVGDIDSSIAATAKAQDINAMLITQKNFKKISDGTYYTSIGEFDDDEGLHYDFLTVLKKADILIYCPPAQWSDLDENNNSYIKDRTIYELLNLICLLTFLLKAKILIFFFRKKIQKISYYKNVDIYTCQLITFQIFYRL